MQEVEWAAREAALMRQLNGMQGEVRFSSGQARAVSHAELLWLVQGPVQGPVHQALGLMALAMHSSSG